MQELIQLLEQPNDAIYSYLKENYFSEFLTDAEEMYFYQNNDSPILLVAHMDTVLIEKIKVKVKRKVLTNEFKQPLGADDRAGVYAIIQILRQHEARGIQKPSVLITHYEENGGVGVKAFLSDKVFVPDGVRLMIEFDRRGGTEYVEYNRLQPEVEEYIEGFGFEKKWGSYSDIADISRETMIPGVNLSIGYYDQHRPAERLHYDELMMTVDRALDMLEDPIPQLYACEVPTYGRAGFQGRGGAYGYGDGGFGGYDDGYGYDAYGSRYGQPSTGKAKGGTGNKAKGSKKGKGNKDNVVGFPGVGKNAQIKREVTALLEHRDPTAAINQEYYDADDSLNELISFVCLNRRCVECGVMWMDCECGDIIQHIIEEFCIEELHTIYLHCLLDGEPIKEQMEDFLVQDSIDSETEFGSEDTGTDDSVH